eukprot:scaffold13.g172.t1
MGTSHQIAPAAADAIAARLARLEGLHLPAHLRGEEGAAGPPPPQAVGGSGAGAGGAGVPEAKRHEYLQALLLRDPGVFLERHGELLTPEERGAFDCLRASFEVNFYLKLLEDQEAAAAGAATGAGSTAGAGGSAAGPAGAPAPPRAAAPAPPAPRLAPRVKNRRLAAMNRLLAEGVFFSDGAMRRRQPALHHQYIGQYRPRAEQQLLDEQEEEEFGGGATGGAPPAPFPVPPAPGKGDAAAGRDGGGALGGAGAPASPRPGALSGRQLAEGILRRQDELEAVLRREEEQCRWAAAEEESESKEEEEEEEEAEAADGGRAASGQRGPSARLADRAAGGGAGAAAGAEGAAEISPMEGEEGKGEDEEGHVVVPEEERADYAAAFLDLMKQRFLHGGDAQHVDYCAIDADASLDEDWAREERQDAEDAYFDTA